MGGKGCLGGGVRGPTQNYSRSTNGLTNPLRRRQDGGPATQTFPSRKENIRYGVKRACQKPTYDGKSPLFAQETHSAEGECSLARRSSNPDRDSHLLISGKGFSIFLSPSFETGFSERISRMTSDPYFPLGASRADFYSFPSLFPTVFTLTAFSPSSRRVRGADVKKMRM